MDNESNYGHMSENVRPLEESRLALAEQIVKTGDEAGRAVLDKASRELGELVLERTTAASEKFSADRAAFFQGIGTGAESFFYHAGKNMQNLSHRPYAYYGTRK